MAEEEIIRYKTRTVVPKEKSKPVRKPIPENIPRVKEHIYPKNFESEEERKQRIQAVYTEIQKMLYNERKNMRAKEKKEHV